jgi:hypothetical protein
MEFFRQGGVMLRRFFNWRNWRGRFVYCLTFIVIGLYCGVVSESSAATAVVTWSPSSDVDGYIVYYGTQPRQYEYEKDCGDVTECELFFLDDQTTYYIAVRAYNWVGQFSDYSNEAVFIGSSDLGADVYFIPHIEMSLVRVDSEEIYGEDGRGENAIDGNPSTFWHTEWYYADPVYPHEIVIDLGNYRQVCGFSYLPRQDGCYNGGIAAYEFYVSTDGYSWGNPVATGVFPHTSQKQEVAFDARVALYVRLVALSEAAGQAWTSAAEIDVMEQVGEHLNLNKAPEAVIKADLTSGFAPLTVTFNANSSSDSDGYVVEYRWNFGDGESETGGATISHDFMTSGTYSVTLTVVDNEGATAQAQVAITVNDTTVVDNEGATDQAQVAITVNDTSVEVIRKRRHR